MASGCVNTASHCGECTTGTPRWPCLKLRSIPCWPQ
jgi:hypothetical protein